MKNPTGRNDVIVVPHRPSRFPTRVALPIAIMFAALFGLALRAADPDWRGLWQEAGDRIGPMFAAKTKAEGPKVETPALARAETPPLSFAPTEKSKPAEKPKAEAKDEATWDAIKRDAEKAQAERDEAEKLKEKAAEDLANNPPPPPIRRGRVRVMPAPDLMAENDRRRFEAMLREQLAMIREQRPQFAAPPRDLIEQQMRMMEEFARGPGFPGPLPGFGNFFGPLPGLGDFGPPLPGMDRFFQPLPGQPRVQREDLDKARRDRIRRIRRAGV